MTFSAADLATFSAVVQDTNPVHRGDAPIVHAGLLIGLACAAATKLRPGWVCASTRFDFGRSFCVGDDIMVDLADERAVAGGITVRALIVGAKAGWATGEIILMEPR